MPLDGVTLPIIFRKIIKNGKKGLRLNMVLCQITKNLISGKNWFWQKQFEYALQKAWNFVHLIWWNRLVLDFNEIFCRSPSALYRLVIFIFSGNHVGKLTIRNWSSKVVCPQIKFCLLNFLYHIMWRASDRIQLICEKRPK